MDPWMITPVERARHAEQFASLGPINGFVTGAQARGFFMQSGLPPMILAQIWGLADMNGDGQMDLNEFSIACKLITLKLKGFEIPSVLPQSILIVPQVGVPMAPVSSMPGSMPGMMPQHSAGMTGMHGMSVPASSMVMSMHNASMASTMPHNTMAGMGMQMGNQVPMSMGIQSNAPMMAQGMPAMSNTMGGAPMMQQAPVSMPFTSIAQGSSPGSPATSVLDWTIPQPTQVKYTQIFQNTDKARTGFLAGIQAGNILKQSGLPQNILAQIWGLSDLDKDGRLSLEEFILSGHLCDLASKGEPLPGVLPPNLIPPRYRKALGAPPAPASTAPPPQASTVSAVSTPGSSHGGASSPASSSFEDKRRENFNKGQAELERRRQSLIDQQKKEEEERKKKEKEEAEEREKQRKELERQRLAEWEKQRKEELTSHRVREQEKLIELKARNEELKKNLDGVREKVTNLTSNIGESRSGISEVKTYIDGMRSSRDTKMADLNSLKTKLKDLNERLLVVTQEKAQLESKTKANAAKLADGESNPELTDFDIKKMEKEKTVTALRDNLDELKKKEGEAKERYDVIKGELEAHKEDLKKIIKSCQDLYDSFDEKRREIKAEKAKRIRELTDPDHAWGNEDEYMHKEEDAVAAHITDHLGESHGHATAVDMGGDIVHYRALYEYEARNEDELTLAPGDIIIAQAHQEGNEPGWLGGEINGKVGWFPEAYVELVSDHGGHVDAIPSVEYEKVRALFDSHETDNNRLSFDRGEILEVLNKVEADWWLARKNDGAMGFVPAKFFATEQETRGSTPTESPSIDNDLTVSMSNFYVALYPYQSTEEGDLNFEAGEIIHVTKKENEWWTGCIGDRAGLFPYNYVQELEQIGKAHPEQPPTVPEHQDHVQNVEHEAPQVSNETHAPAPTTEKQQHHLQTGTAKKKKKKDEAKKNLGIATVLAPYKATSKEQLSLNKGQMILIRKKTETGWWQGEIQGKKGEKKQIGWFPASFVKVLEKAKPSGTEAAGKDPSATWLRALYPYTRQNDDELTFQEGSMIKLISKDEDVWWKGELDGEIGVFPSNYVEEVAK